MNKHIIIGFESQENYELYPEELEICKNYKSQKRVLEYKRGRIAAKKCLEKLGIYSFPILKSANGDPIWPLNIAGSISHSNDLAVAVISKEHKFIGVDLEYLKQSRNPEIFKRICTEKELTWQDKDLEKGIRIFSAKEAIYKAFFNIEKLSWMDVELDESQKGFSCKLTKNIKSLPQTFQCYQSRHDQDYLLSLVAE